MSFSATDLLLPDQMTVRGAGEAVAGTLPVKDGTQGEHLRNYYDTFDGLLHAAGCSLVHEDGRLSLIERTTGLVRGSLATPPPRMPLFATELEPGSLRDSLRELTDLRALLPLVQVHSRERRMSVLDGEQKTVVRLALEETTLAGHAGTASALRPRLRITPVRGYDKERHSVQATLEQQLGFKPADEPLVDEAVRVAGGVPGGFPAKVDVPLRPEQRADIAAAAVLRALLEVIEANLEGTIEDLDTEFLHDLRVSVRRSRAVQRELKGVFGPAALARFRAEFRWLQQITGDARDLDVHVLEFESMRGLVPAAMQGDLDPLLDVLRARRARAHRRLVEDLRSKRATELLSSWRTFLDRLAETDETERPDAARPIGDVAGERIRRVYRRMVRMGDAIDESSPAQDYHELRKKGKELRYLLELFGSALYPGEVVKPMIRTLKGLQDVLGRHQDREVQVSLLRSLAPEVARCEGGEAGLLAVGALIARLAEDEAAARDEFAGRFEEFAAKDQRQLVAQTFGP
ncbi:MAG TPA: CHAD domain-containing protein [Solirubrobacteraceae bacterium]|nr:CHAD domain-containing protein [Solirubrobacteraceae bacterium]